MDQHDTQDLAQFRQTVYQNFNKRADTLMDLVDALCSQTRAKSVVELSLEPADPEDPSFSAALQRKLPRPGGVLSQNRRTGASGRAPFAAARATPLLAAGGGRDGPTPAVRPHAVRARVRASAGPDLGQRRWTAALRSPSGISTRRWRSCRKKIASGPLPGWCRWPAGGSN